MARFRCSASTSLNWGEGYFYFSLYSVQDCNLGQNGWKIKTTPPPISMMEKWRVFVVARVLHWIGGRGTSISHFILSKIVGPWWPWRKLPPTRVDPVIIQIFGRVFGQRSNHHERLGTCRYRDRFHSVVTSCRLCICSVSWSWATNQDQQQISTVASKGHQ